MNRNYIILFVIIACFVFKPTKTDALNNRGFHSDMTFIDLEDISNKYKKNNEQNVRIINHANSPIIIKNASVADKGTIAFKDLHSAQNTYEVEVQNTTNRLVLAYQVTWVLKHPFEDFIYHKIHTNSINKVDPNASQKLTFRRPKHFRDDAYYYVEISKVEFYDNESVWEAPDIDSFTAGTQYDAIKEEIDSMPEDEIDLQALKKEIDQEEEEFIDAVNEEELENEKSQGSSEIIIKASEFNSDKIEIPETNVSNKTEAQEVDLDEEDSLEEVDLDQDEDEDNALEVTDEEEVSEDEIDTEESNLDEFDDDFEDDDFDGFDFDDEDFEDFDENEIEDLEEDF
jgi:hypothetical protein